jgi:hypothetical protein
MSAQHDTGEQTATFESRAGLRVRVTLEETDRGALVKLAALNCDLEGEEPERHYLAEAAYLLIGPPDGERIYGLRGR